MIKKIGLAITILLILNGCTGKQLVAKKNQESALITIKTPSMKYSDMGFVYQNDTFVKVEIYSMGQPLMSLDINGMNVCMSTFECMEKKDFNTKILSANYPDTLLENIFRAKPLFDKLNLEENSNGFTQEIKKEGEYKITYSVIGKKRTFHDTINKILIKVIPQ